MSQPEDTTNNGSFDLERAIERWAKALRSQPGIEAGDAADLEGYLRDKIEGLVGQGLEARPAFGLAAAECAPDGAIGREYVLSRAIVASAGSGIGRTPLLVNYARIALRKILRQKGYSFINIAGLAVGLAACLLILLWVKDELSFDDYHEKADRVYRLSEYETIGGVSARFAVAPFISAPVFTAEIPEIETYARLLVSSPLAAVEDRRFDLTRIYYTDPGFFDIFSHIFLAGDRETALELPGSLVLTEETARRLFGRTDIVGETVNFDNAADYKVTAVVADVPANSHLRFNGLASIDSIAERPDIRPIMENWFRINGWVYFLLKEREDRAAVEAKMEAVTLEHVGDQLRQSGSSMAFRLQPLSDIHLRSRLEGEIGAVGDIRYVYAFTIIAAFILVLACVNFMNLATARSAGRGREVGLRKVLGARRGQLMLQFLGESVLMTLLAAGVALVLVTLALPAFNQLADKSIGPDSLVGAGTVLALLGLVLLTGFLGGSYPALFMSSFRPSAVLKGAVGRGFKKGSFRSALVVFQFSVSIVLMAGAMIVLSQTRYMKTRDLGFNKDRVLVVNVRDAVARRNAEAMADDLKSSPNIGEATIGSGVPGRISTSLVVSMEGRPERDSFSAWTIWSDGDFVRTYGMAIAHGRDFSPSFPSDAQGAFLVNETAAMRMGWGADAVGRKIGFDTNDRGEIVGVMKDFHFGSLKSPIAPLVVRMVPTAELVRRGRFLSLRLKGGDVAKTVDFVGARWAERSERGFEFFFADENFDALYRAEERMGRIISGFAAMAVFVACLGLFGLASYAAEQRTKEIGVRKVLGASEPGLAGLLTKEFVKWVMLANLIALPAAFVLIGRYWLANFAYRTAPGILAFLSITGLSLVISVLTVSWQAVRAARANPADSLRYE